MHLNDKILFGLCFQALFLSLFQNFFYVLESAEKTKDIQSKPVWKYWMIIVKALVL